MVEGGIRKKWKKKAKGKKMKNSYIERIVANTKLKQRHRKGDG
jgi:hypothetical protein